MMGPWTKEFEMSLSPDRPLNDAELDRVDAVLSTPFLISGPATTQMRIPSKLLVWPNDNSLLLLPPRRGRDQRGR